MHTSNAFSLKLWEHPAYYALCIAECRPTDQDAKQRKKKQSARAHHHQHQSWWRMDIGNYSRFYAVRYRGYVHCRTTTTMYVHAMAGVIFRRSASTGSGKLRVIEMDGVRQFCMFRFACRARECKLNAFAPFHVMPSSNLHIVKSIQSHTFSLLSKYVHNINSISRARLMNLMR